MATLLLSGTRLEPHAPNLPLNKPFLFALAVVYLLAMHFFMLTRRCWTGTLLQYYGLDRDQHNTGDWSVSVGE